MDDTTKFSITFYSLIILMTQPSVFAEKSKLTNQPKTYSLSTDALNAMEQQLKSLLENKLISTPKVNPEKALPPIVLEPKNITESTHKQSARDFFSQLITAAKKRTEVTVKYDGSYRYISYPMGDVAANRGVCTDLVIRTYRHLGVDLQQLVHEDIKDNFSLYPSKAKWGNMEPDPNIDHRRVYNLQIFFKRFGKSLPITNNPKDYQPGDLVTWQLGPKLPHIGIVVDEFTEELPDRPLIIHNIGQGPKQEDILFSFPITGHYRYKPGKKTASPSSPYPTVFNIKKKPETQNSPNMSLVEAADLLLP